jgi:cellulose synthase/poly-beta-1,6-N-acetylglucosamine synthase-like glycosyltransferase
VPLPLAGAGTTALHDAQSIVLLYFLVVNLLLVVLLASSALEMRKHRLELWHALRERLLGSSMTPRISVLAPAHDEARTVSESLRSMLALRYPDLEVILVNDGSSDATLAILQRDFDLVAICPIFRRRLDSEAVRGLYRSRSSPGLVVVDKANGGKADALNAGLNIATGELVCAIDADTVINSDALLRMVRPFLADERVIAAGGTIRVVNGAHVHNGRVVSSHAPRGFLAGMQALEYLRAFLTGRLGWNRLGGNLIISGAFGMFRREQTIQAGGYEHDTVGEDMELVARLRRRAIETGSPDTVVFIPDPVAWTEVPETARGLGRQRERWHRGLADVLWRHRRALLNPRYRSLGLVALPYFTFIELIAPVVEAAGLLGMAVAASRGAIEPVFACLFFLLAYGLGLVITVLTLALDEWSYRTYDGLGERMRLLGFAMLEQLGYRQLTVAWRLRGLVNYLCGRSDWGVMTRTGFSSPDPPQASSQPPGP